MPNKRKVTSEEFASLSPGGKVWWRSPTTRRYFKVEGIQPPGASCVKVQFCRTGKTVTAGFQFFANLNEIYVSSQA